MADTIDPDAPPMHHEIVEDYPAFHLWLAGFLGVAATAAGIVLGLILIND
jgi:hypothetical protein